MKIKLDTKGRRLMLTDLLAEEGILLQTPCGGQGTCGKCAVRVMEGDFLPMLPGQEEQLRSAGLLSDDEHLACQLQVSGALEIELKYTDEGGFYIPEHAAAAELLQGENGEALPSAVLIDIGTTTICFALTDLKGGAVYARHACLNRQRRFGADVISRIKAAEEGHAGQMQALVREDMAAGIRQLVEKAGRPVDIRRALIAGNTTMLHLLTGKDARGLGHYPFTPVSLEMEDMSLSDLIGEEAPFGHARVSILPGISAFVGADIVAGLMTLKQAEKPALFIDLGTNAEMALITDRQIFVTSAAAGPAFEGGNISCGTGSIPGAITRVWRQYGLWRYETIGKGAAAGICGSGLISLIAALIRDGLIDRHGTLQDKFHGSLELVPGKVRLTQADIRAFQEAKAAVRSGICLLLQAAGLKEDEVREIYLAGGFGSSMDAADACRAGLLPQTFAEKTKAAGNTVLSGLRTFLQEDARDDLRQMIGTAVVLGASEQESFNEIYIGFMTFDI